MIRFNSGLIGNRLRNNFVSEKINHFLRIISNHEEGLQ